MATSEMSGKHHILSVLVENKFGVLTRVTGLFSGRGYNIDTLNVGPTNDARFSRITIVTHGDEATLEQIVKQLNKLPNVIKVQDFREGEFVDRELALVKVRASDANRSEIVKIVELYRARVVDITEESVIVEATGTEAEVDALVALLRSFGIKELVRTGTVVMARGPRSIEEAIKR